jgi:putative oligomerization/nucleic acid binding protein
MSLLKTAARTAVASSVHGRIQRRQQERWAAADQARSAAPPSHAQFAPPPAPAPAPPPAPAAPPPPPAPAPTAPGTDELLSQLERLGNLRASGVLTEEEFAAQKARLLG